MYFMLLLIFRAAGNRSLAQITSFDFVLLLIIGEATQQALLGNDFSITNALLVIIIIVALEISLSILKLKVPWMDRLIDGRPLILVADGKPFLDRMRKSHVSEEDILNAARELRGLGRMDQIQYAVMECHGGISIIPKTGQSGIGELKMGS